MIQPIVPNVPSDNRYMNNTKLSVSEAVDVATKNKSKEKKLPLIGEKKKGKQQQEQGQDNKKDKNKKGSIDGTGEKLNLKI